MNIRKLLIFFFIQSAAVWPAAGHPLPDGALEDGGPRVVATGDVHGSLNGLVGILEKTKLIDSSRRWTGGKSVFVQTGDLVDRGPADRAVLDLMMQLERQARRSGGKVEALLGNHEVMNLMGDLRYTSEETFASFADKNSVKRRETAYRQYEAFQKRRALRLGQPEPVFSEESKEEWMMRHPLGYLEHRQALGPDGKYGKWLRKRPVVVRHADTIFTHGGLSPSLDLELEEINSRVGKEIEAFDKIKAYMTARGLILPFFDLGEMTKAAAAEIRVIQARTDLNQSEQQHLQILETFIGHINWLSVHPDGPLWFRGYATWTDEEAAIQLERLTSRYGAHHFVAGHTTMLWEGIQMRFGGRVFLIDTGMLSSFYDGGGASALVIENGRFAAVYADRTGILYDSSHYSKAAP